MENKVVLADLSSQFIPSKRRYVSPRHEAMQLRTLWSGRKIPEAAIDFQEAAQLCHIVEKKLKEGAELSSNHHLITRGLVLNPKVHFFYGWKGDLHCQKNNWTQAIKNYKLARTFSKTRPSPTEESVYKNKLIQAYIQRGSDHEKNKDFLNALSDYEQVLILTPEESVEFTVQDKILGILRSMERYIAYRFHWTEFTKLVNRERTSVLLTQHAEYKIHLREMTVARYILFEAIELDEKNAKARQLLQTIFLIGHSMVAHAIMWCSYGCYDKALLTIEKGRDCDPYNPGYTLLKAILLRLSGRLNEAAVWLKILDKGFHQLLDPSKDTHGSILGNLTIENTKQQLVQQWHLIRYDRAVQLMIQGKYEEAIHVLSDKNLLQMFAETYTLLGDCYQNLQMPILALQYYIKSFEKYRDMKTLKPKSQKYLYLMQRLKNMINSDIFNISQTREMANLKKNVVQIFIQEKEKI